MKPEKWFWCRWSDFIGTRTIKVVHSRCWSLGCRVLSAVAAAAVICLTECSARAPMEWPTADRNWSRMYALLSNRDRHDVMGLSCNILNFFFRRRIFWLLRMRAMSFISTPAFSVHLCKALLYSFDSQSLVSSSKNHGRLQSTELRQRYYILSNLFIYMPLYS